MTSSKKDEIKIQFKPLNEGLGLNHFSDGLPYQNQNLKRKSPVRFNFPPPREPSKTPIPQTLPTEAQAQPAEDVAVILSPAGFFKRVTAYCLDLVFITAIFTGVTTFAFYFNGIKLNQLKMLWGMQLIVPLALLLLVMYYGYFLIQELSWQKTLGKALFSIKINTPTGTHALARALCFSLSVIPLGLGLLWFFFDSQKRCWHDKISESLVVNG